MVVVPRTRIELGFATTVKLAGGGTAIATVAVDDMVEVVVKEAVTITEVGRLPAVKLTEAMPQVAPGHAPVTAVALDNVATAGLFNVNVIV